MYPDITYLTQRADRLQAIVLTHGHEDHIGALPYLLKYLDVPVYATALTRGLAEIKLKEAGLLADSELHTVTSADVLDLGCFRVEFFHVCHSIPDAVGIIVHNLSARLSMRLTCSTGPVDGKLTEVDAAPRRLGVLLDVGFDQRRTAPASHPPSSRSTPPCGYHGCCAGPHHPRDCVQHLAIQQVLNIARANGRRVGVIGRSMVNNVRMAAALGYLDTPYEDLLGTSEMNNLPPEQVVIVCTGSQGEPSAVLARLAANEHAQLQIQAGDTVVLSATPIPGNEEMVNRIINDLFRLGADVIY